MNPPTIGSIDSAFDDDVSTSVVQQVAERAGVDATELPPLYDSIDPDALDAIFASTTSSTSRSGRIEFTYAGYRVTVSSDDGILLAHESAAKRADQAVSSSI